MKKRIFSLLLCLVMALSLVPSMAFAETYPDTIRVRNSNGQHIHIHGGQCLKTNTAEGAVDYHGGADYVVMYNSDKGELHLRGFQGKIENNNESTATSVISVQGDCTIIVEQDSVLTINQDDTVTKYERYGIYAGGALKIGGSGKLTVNINNNALAYGIYAENGMTVYAAMEMNDNNPSSGSFYGLYAWSGEIALTGNAKTIRLNANEGYPYAIYNLAYDADVTGNGNITVKCPLTITNSGDNGANGSGIVTGQSSYNANGVITLDGADVSISGLSQDIWDGSMERTGADGIVIKDSKLSVSATAADSNAIRSVYNNVSVLNSTVTASSDASSIRAGAVSIKDSEVDLTANTLGGASRVIYTYDNAVNTVDLSGGGFVKLTFIGELEFSLISGKVVVGKDTACTKGVYDTDWENYHGVAEGGNTVTVFAHGTAEANIVHVEAAGVALPVAGEHPTFDWTTDDSAGYTVITSYSQYWYNETDGKWMTASDVFEAGKTYQLIMPFRPKDGNSFADDGVMTASLTGIDPALYQVTGIYKAGGGSYPNRTVHYEFVVSGGETAGTFTTQPADITVAVGEEATYSFVFTGDIDDAYDSTLMYKNGDTWMDWNYIGPKSGVTYTGTLNAESTATSKVFKFSIRSAGKWVESNEFTVTWSDPDFLKGDVNGDGEVTDADAVYLLYYTFFGDASYPVNQPCDFNGDGEVTDADAVYLLYYTFFGDESYPLH